MFPINVLRLVSAHYAHFSLKPCFISLALSTWQVLLSLNGNSAFLCFDFISRLLIAFFFYCVPIHPDIDLISRFAQLEVKFGEIERGKTLFDTMMMSYPKRTDLWIVYVDTLTKAGEIDGARYVFSLNFLFALHFQIMA